MSANGGWGYDASEQTVSVCAISGVQAFFRLRDGSSLHAAVVEPLSRGTVGLRPWGCSTILHVRLSDVKLATVTEGMPWVERQEIVAAQRRKYDAPERVAERWERVR